MNRRRRAYRVIELIVLICTLIIQALYGQDNAPGTAQSTIGTVTRINADTQVISLKTDQNQELTITTQGDTSYRRVAPGETDLRNAATIAFTDIAMGDRVLARGNVGRTGVSATLVVVMAQADVKAKQAAEKADWDKRGISGLVTAIASDSVTIGTRTAAGVSPMVLAVLPGTVVRRYAPDSINFSDARPARLDEIRIGDQVRARGDKTPDGAKLAAVEIVAGTFKTSAGIVLSSDASRGEIRIRDLDTKMNVIVKTNSDTRLQKISPQTAQSIAARLHPEAAGRGARGSGGSGDIQQMLEASPATTLAEIKNSDAVVVSSTVGSAAGTITAIRLVTGVEPILTKPGTKEMSIGAWTLEVGGGGGGQ